MRIIISEKFILGSNTQERFENHIKNTLGISPQYLDEGSDGIVYSINQTTAIKFSNTPPTVEKSLIGKSIPGIISYYKSGQIDIPEEIYSDREFQFLNRANAIKNSQKLPHMRIYWVTMERLSAPPLRILEAIDGYFDQFEAQHPSSYHQKLFNFIIEADGKEKRDFLSYTQEMPQVVHRYIQNLYTIGDSLKANGIPYDDFRFDQLGVDSNGDLKLFDLTST